MLKTKEQWEAEGLPDTIGLRRFVDAYIEAAYFTEGGPDNEAFDEADLARETLEEIWNQCRNFYNQHWKLLYMNCSQAGHDFWLTRNGHGAGFWDRPEIWGEEGAKLLTDACGWHTEYPEMDLYIGDDGRIYA